MFVMKTSVALFLGILLLLACITGASTVAHAQGRTPSVKRPADSTRTKPAAPATRRGKRTPADTTRRNVDSPLVKPAVADSTTSDSLRADSVDTRLRVDSVGTDSLAVGAGSSGVDTMVTGVARERIVVDLKARRIHLYRKAELDKPPQKLTADYIRMDFDRSELYATAAFDSATKKYSDVPLLRDGTQELTANTLTYNFKTKRGTLGAAETKMGDGFYYGERIKQVAQGTYFVQDGRYTTCDAPHPHYFFSSPRMKVITGDRVFADQVVLNIADVPVLYLPFGVYFPSHGGRQGGIIIPSFSQTASRGLTLEHLGLFVPFSDYVDDKLDADLYSKGGFTLRNQTRLRVRGLFDQADLNLTYGRTRNDPDDPFNTNYIIDGRLQMPVGKRGHIGGNVFFSSLNAIRNSTTQALAGEGLDDYTRTSVTSDLSFSTSTAAGHQFSVGYHRDQSLVTRDLTQRVPVSVSFPTIIPFSSSTGTGFMDNLSLGFSFGGAVERVQSDTLPDGSFRINEFHGGLSYRPSISFTPRFGPVSISPFFSYSGSLFARRISKSADGDTIAVREFNGFYHAFSYSTGVSVSTSLYGIMQPRVFGINAIRHTFSPSISASYSPDFSARKYGMYDEFFNPVTNSVQKYSIFEKDASIASVPGVGEQQSLSITLRNEFEAKIAQGDTLEDKKVKLLSLTLSTSYNAAAAEYKWGSVTATANTDLGTIGYLSGNASFDLYEADSLGRRRPKVMLQTGSGIARVQSAGITFSTSFGDQGFTTGAAGSGVSDSAAARRERFDFSQVVFNDSAFFGEHVEGDAAFRLPWNVALSGSYTLFRSSTNQLTPALNLNAGFSFSLTPTTRITSSASYDVLSGAFGTGSIGLAKDLHCWEMRFDWNPSGTARGYYFRIGLKAPQLQDVKYDSRGYSYE